MKYRNIIPFPQPKKPVKSRKRPEKGKGCGNPPISHDHKKGESQGVSLPRVLRDTPQKRVLLLPGSLPGNPSIHSGRPSFGSSLRFRFPFFPSISWLRLGSYLIRHYLSPLTQLPSIGSFSSSIASTNRYRRHSPFIT